MTSSALTARSQIEIIRRAALSMPCSSKFEYLMLMCLIRVSQETSVKDEYGHDLRVFTPLILCATKLKTATDEMNSTRL